MANPTLHIVNGPGRRDLEQAFLARNLGAKAMFTIFVEDYDPMLVGLKILNFGFVTCHGPNYKLGGTLIATTATSELPAHNFIFVEFNVETKRGKMEFSNAE